MMDCYADSSMQRDYAPHAVERQMHFVQRIPSLFFSFSKDSKRCADQLGTEHVRAWLWYAMNIRA